MVQVKIGVLTSPSDFISNKKNLNSLKNSTDLLIRDKKKIEKEKVGVLKIIDSSDCIGGIGIYQIETIRNLTFDEIIGKHQNLLEGNINERSSKITVYRDFYFIISKETGLIFLYSESALPKDNICRYFLGRLNKIFSQNKEIDTPEFFNFPESKFDDLRKIMLRKNCEEHKLLIEHEKYDMLATGSLHKDNDLEKVKDIRSWKAWKYIGFEISNPDINFFQFPKNTTRKFIITFGNSVSLTDFDKIFNLMLKLYDVFNMVVGKNIEYFLYPLEAYQKLDEFF